jgi:hypothetical protein
MLLLSFFLFVIKPVFLSMMFNLFCPFNFLIAPYSIIGTDLSLFKMSRVWTYLISIATLLARLLSSSEPIILSSIKGKHYLSQHLVKIELKPQISVWCANVIYFILTSCCGQINIFPFALTYAELPICSLNPYPFFVVTGIWTQGLLLEPL